MKNISLLPAFILATAATLLSLLFIVSVFYILGYQQETIPLQEPPVISVVEPVHILFTGDMMLDRNVALHAKTFGDESLIAQVERMFLGVDAAVTNLAIHF
jgi:hypothetical protein